MMQNVTHRPLTMDDQKQVRYLDNESGNCVEEWLDDECYGFGAFLNDTLIAYCTIGYADDCGIQIESHHAHTSDSLLLSNVFVLPKYRYQNIATNLIQYAIAYKHLYENQEYGIKPQAVYLTLLHDKLHKLYKKIGFQWIDNTKSYAMIKLPNTNPYCQENSPKIP